MASASYKTVIEDLQGTTKLDLGGKNIGDEDVKSLAEALKGSRVTELDLCNNEICDGIKHLADVLKDTEITKLLLKNNNIGDEGVKHLFSIINDTKLATLDLRDNAVGCDAALYINRVLIDSKINSLFLDIYCTTEDGTSNKCFSQRSIRYAMKVNAITLHNSKIGIKGAQFLNESFSTIGIDELYLKIESLEANEAQFLAKAFQNIKICKFDVCNEHIWQSENIEYLVEAFKGSRIIKLVSCGRIYCPIAYLAEFLKGVKVLKLIVSKNQIKNEGLEILAPVVQMNGITELDLGMNEIDSTGIQYLSRVLRSSKIIHLDLSGNSLGIEGAQHLADGLKGSQVTYLNLLGNDIKMDGYRHLVDVIDETNISEVNLKRNNIEAQMRGTSEFNFFAIPRNTTSVAVKVCNAFKTVVKFNSVNDEFEFLVPETGTDLEQYIFLVQTLLTNPNAKVHIFKMLCDKDNYYDYDLDTMKKIDQFVGMMPKKFNELIKEIKALNSFPIDVEQLKEAGLLDADES